MQVTFLPISASVSRDCPSAVKRSNVTAVSRTLEFQKPDAVCRIASGVGEDVFTVVDVSNLSQVTSGG